jgi:hypothetical protein
VPSRRQHRPDPGPLQTNDVVIIAIGTAAWVAGLLVLLGLRLTGTAEVRDWWLGMCGYGIALGVYGMYYARRRHLAIERDAALGIPPRS